jgi:histidinol dehydrogenase
VRARAAAATADEGANPAHVAADLLSQAEHGPDSQVVLLALPGVDLDAVQTQVQKQCDELPRNETARKALAHSCILQVHVWACACAWQGWPRQRESHAGCQSVCVRT